MDSQDMFSDDFKVILTLGEIHQFYQTHGHSLKLTVCAHSILTDLGLSIIQAPNEHQDLYSEYEAAKDIVRQRLGLFLKKWKKANYQWGKMAPNDTFLDLSVSNFSWTFVHQNWHKFNYLQSDFPHLVDYGQEVPNSQHSRPGNSQASAASALSSSSVKSWIEEEVPLPNTKRRKAFQDLVPGSKRNITNNIYWEFLKKAEDLEMDPKDLICYIGSRATYIDNKKASEAFGAIAKGQHVKEVPVDLSTHVRTSLRISSRKWTEMKYHFKDFATLPPYRKISTYIHQLLPTLLPFHHGVAADVYEVVQKTLARLPKDILQRFADADCDKNGFIAEFVGGYDGAGSHQVYNTLESLQDGVDTTHMLFAGIALMTIKQNDDEGTVVYKTENPASLENERPIVIAPGKEDDTNFAKDVHAIFSSGIEKLRKEAVLIPLNDVDSLIFRVKLKLTQLDGKARAQSSGLRGAFCLMCTASKKDAHDIEKIKAGFPINRTMDSIHEKFEALKVQNDDGEWVIPRQSGDYNDRQGLTSQPLTHQDVVTDFSVLHSLIRSLYFFEQLAYRINAEVYKWGEKQSDADKAALNLAKEEFKQKCPTVLEMQLDMPNPKGGSTDTGNTARKFFSNKSRDKVMRLVQGFNVEQKCYRKLLQNFNIILKVIGSDRLVDVDALADLCQETYVMILTQFSWVQLPQSIHALLAHAAERISLYEGHGLKRKSEEPLESCHQLIRKMREAGARKTSLEENIADVFTHVWIQSDPELRCKKRKVSCSNCKETGHTIRKCHLLKEEDEDADDKLLKKFFIQQ